MKGETLEQLDNLRASETRYRRLFESARDGILILDAGNGEITDVNPYMEELLDYPRADFLGKQLSEIGLLKDKQASAHAFRLLQQNGYIRYESLPLETRSGKKREVEFVSNIYEEAGRSVIQC
ncbi:MAG: PAS domain-containing protein, partial [Acidobacteria bacterium]|nr:PAS domain-containing protein [Acidobacteriota bacterium]